MPIRRLETTFTGTSGTIGADELTSTALASVEHVKPHIQPGTLQPAVAGKLLNGATHSGAYGTAQTQSGGDGHSYYYTDIKGSKPIKDPRIGAHFGSQRHKFKSLQKLEQETATNGTDVYSVDGREWLRASGSAGVYHNSEGTYIFIFHNDAYVEVVGYFINANVISKVSVNRSFKISIDGGSVGSLMGEPTIASPLTGRFVDGGSVYNIGASETLGIHTIKIFRNPSDDLRLYGIELIAQDTTSTATKSQIQIPAQTVVSYGKKFALSAAAPHYNPFAFKTDGTTAWASGAHNGTAWPVGTGSSANIDTATSLGLSAWISTNYYKPYNGGRVVWWIDSSGTLKCSVNMMPPNARNVGPTAATEKGDDSAGTTSAAVANNTYLPTFTDQAIDNTQAEVAKTFHWREFGNGAANGGTLASNNADTTMLGATGDNIAYVMDDGLTSFSMVGAEQGSASNNNYLVLGSGESPYVTFIGTGFSIIGRTWGGVTTNDTIAQNLPYGTHIVKIHRNGSDMEISIDGVKVYDVATGNHQTHMEYSFHQPKMPPIPENAVVLADYMLMADFVSIPDNTVVDKSKLTKGVRRISSSRDVFTSGANTTFQFNPQDVEVDADGFRQYFNTSGGIFELPYFGTSPVYRSGVYNDRTNNANFKINGTDVTTSSSGTNHSGTQVLRSWTSGTHGFSSDNNGTFTTFVNTTDEACAWASVEGIIVGQNTVRVTNNSSDYLTFNGYDVHTPIHTSSHYQSFETPFLHELVGGDRNMEQTNLVVSSDGKTWDEVTRDTSYLGNMVLRASTDTAHGASSNRIIFDEWRGTISNAEMYTKHFAIGYDVLICLTDGEYLFNVASLSDSNSYVCRIYVNEAERYRGHSVTNDESNSVSYSMHLKRGDRTSIRSVWHTDRTHSNFNIVKLS